MNDARKLLTALKAHRAEMARQRAEETKRRCAKAADAVVKGLKALGEKLRDAQYHGRLAMIDARNGKFS